MFKLKIINRTAEWVDNISETAESLDDSLFFWKQHWKKHWCVRICSWTRAARILFGRGRSNRKEHGLMVYFPGQKGLGVCIQEQSDVLGHDFRCGYRFGMDFGINIRACCGMIPSKHVDKQVG